MQDTALVICANSLKHVVSETLLCFGDTIADEKAPNTSGINTAKFVVTYYVLCGTSGHNRL